MFKFIKTTSFCAHTFCPVPLNESSVVVDLGANIGEFSRQLNKITGCQCYAVEASPELYSRIPQTNKIKVFNYAISDKNDPVILNLSSDPEGNSIHHLPATLVTNTVTVQGITLPSFLAQNGISEVDLLKIDIEGAEIELFNSLTDEELLKFKQITIEFHDFIPAMNLDKDVALVKKRLKALGFYYINLYQHSNDDVLYLNRRLLKVPFLEYFYLAYVNKYLRGFFRRLKKKIRRAPGLRLSGQLPQK